MKTEELRDLSRTELIARSRELKDELFHLRIKKAGGQLEDPSQIRKIRKEVARIETILTQRRQTQTGEGAAAVTK